MVKNKYSNAGITLITLVITVIVLLILASITIATLNGENGILTRASEAKIKTAIGNIKENLSLEQNERVIDNKEDLSPEVLLSEKKVKRILQLKEDGNYYMYYIIRNEAYDGMQGLGNGTPSTLKDVFLIDDKFNIKYIDKTGREYGENIEDKILKDETDIRFSSKAFSEYISKIAGVPEDEMKFKWTKNQTSLTIADAEIDSLEDLVFFPNLLSLSIGDASASPPISTLDGVENCLKLTQLSINYGKNKDYTALEVLNNLTTFRRLGGSDFDNIIDHLKFCVNLDNLEITFGEITSMKRIAEIGDLKSLALNNNKITKIEGLENKASLETLYLVNNKITKIEGLDKLLNLKNLYLSMNQISDITPLSLNTELKVLDLRKNSEIDGNRNEYTGEKLEALNKIEEILDRGGTISLDADKISLFTNYKNIDLTGQNLETLELLEGMKDLTNLNLNNNELTLEDEESQEILQNMTNLTILQLSNNKITNIVAINSLKNLTYLYLTGDDNKVNLKEIEDIISNLICIRVSNDSLKTIINCDINKITTLNLIGSSLTEIPNLSRFTRLSSLSLENNPNISNFDIVSRFTSLENLNLSRNDLHGKMIDFLKLTNLTNLDLSSNTLWSEDLENLKALKNNENLTIDLSNHSIIDASALLELNTNTKINLKGNVNLSQDSKDKLKARFRNNVTF